MLNSLHKYQPRIHIVRIDSQANNNNNNNITNSTLSAAQISEPKLSDTSCSLKFNTTELNLFSQQTNLTLNSNSILPLIPPPSHGNDVSSFGHVQDSSSYNNNNSQLSSTPPSTSTSSSCQMMTTQNPHSFHSDYSIENHTIPSSINISDYHHHHHNHHHNHNRLSSPPLHLSNQIIDSVASSFDTCDANININNNKMIVSYCFPETQFIAVTAYQNEDVSV